MCFFFSSVTSMYIFPLYRMVKVLKLIFRNIIMPSFKENMPAGTRISRGMGRLILPPYKTRNTKNYFKASQFFFFRSFSFSFINLKKWNFKILLGVTLCIIIEIYYPLSYTPRIIFILIIHELFGI